MGNVGDKGDKFAHHARAVALELYGEPNKQLSSKTELRFGSHGSKSVDLQKGTFYDHQEAQGGGVLWAIERETGRGGAQAVEWMREHGFDVEDDRPAPPPRAAGTGPRLDPAGNWLPQRVPDHGRLTKAYDYRDAQGRLMYQVCRYEWTVDPSVNPKGREKTFVQRRPDKGQRSGWSYKMDGVEWLPYRLPELVEDVASGYPIFVVEGEKKADMLRDIGVPATCNHGGAGKFPETLAQWFKGADVIVLPDDDPQAKNKDGSPRFHPDGRPVFPGQDHAELIARRLDGVARRIRVLNIPDLPPKGGVDDWLPAGGSAERLYDLVDELARPLDATPYVSRFGAVEWADLDAPGPVYEELVRGVLTRGELSMLAGASQSGKSFLAIDLCMSIARGIEWFGRRVHRGGVVYQAGESATGVRRKRLPAYRIGHQMTDRDVPFVMLQDQLDLFSSEDPTDAFIDECRHWARRFGAQGVGLELIVIDTLARATPGANENDGKDMGVVLARCERIRRETGACVLLVHHMNADGTKARGHTSTVAAVDSVITVQKLLDSHDGANRQVRSWRLTKAKDGEDGQETKFVLKGVKIGTDQYGDDVFSCIVGEPQVGTGEQRIEEAGLTVGAQNATLLRAIYTAVSTKGVHAPPELALGIGAMAVERKPLWEVVRAAFDADGPPTDIKPDESEEDARNRRDAALRQAVKRAREHLYTKGIIGTKDGWTWLTGKRVRGFEQPPGLSDLNREERRRRRARPQDDQPNSTADLPDGTDLPFDVEDFK